MCQFSVVESKSATFPTERPRHLLDDSVLESHSPVRNHTLNSVFTNGISIGKSSVAGEVPAPACLWLRGAPHTAEAQKLLSQDRYFCDRPCCRLNCFSVARSASVQCRSMLTPRAGFARTGWRWQEGVLPVARPCVSNALHQPKED